MEKYDACAGLGKAYALRGKFGKAALFMEKALSLLAENEKNTYYSYCVVRLLGSTYAKLGRFADAAKLLLENLKYHETQYQSHIVCELKDIYISCGEYEKAFGILNDYAHLFYESYLVYMKLCIRRAEYANRTGRDCLSGKKELLAETAMMADRYEAHDINMLYSDMLAYDFLNIREAADIKEGLLDCILSEGGGICPDESFGDVIELMRLNKLLGSEMEVLRFRGVFEDALQKRFNARGENAYNHYIESNQAKRMSALANIVNFLSISGKIEDAQKYAAMIEDCVMCIGCCASACSKRFESLGIFYEAAGDMERAYGYLKKALNERGYAKWHAVLRLMPGE